MVPSDGETSVRSSTMSDGSPRRARRSVFQRIVIVGNCLAMVAFLGAAWVDGRLSGLAYGAAGSLCTLVAGALAAVALPRRQRAGGPGAEAGRPT